MIGWRRSRRTLTTARLTAPRLIGAAGLCALVVVGRAAAATAAGTPTGPAFSVAPANPDPSDPLSRAYFRPVVNPGGSVTESVVVSDTGDSPVSLYIYPVDGLTGATSGTVYADRSDPRQKAGVWLTAAATALTVQPHDQQLVSFRVDVPAGATPGDHVAGIAFENAHPTHAGGMSVTEVVREVIGVQVRVPGPGQFQLHIDGVRLAVPPAVPAASVVIRVGNDGNRLGQPRLLVTLHGPGGFVDSINRQLDTILPGDTIAYPLAWPRPLPQGAYTIAVIGSGTPPLTYSGTGFLGTAQVGLPQPTVPPATPGVAPVAPSAAAPLTGRRAAHSGDLGLVLLLVGVAVVLAGGAAGIFVFLRRRREAPPPPAVASPTGWHKSALGEPRRVQHHPRP